MISREETAGWNSESIVTQYVNLINSDVTPNNLNKKLYHDRVLYELLPTLSGRSVVELGSGTGYMADHLVQEHTPLQYIAVDYLPMLNYAMKHMKSGSVDLVCANVQSLPLQSEIADVVFSSLLLHWVEDINTLLSEINRVMKRGSAFTVSLAHPDYFKTGSFESTDGYHFVHKTNIDYLQRNKEVKLNGTVGPLIYHKRSVDEYVEAFSRNGFYDVQVFEPTITDAVLLEEYPTLLTYKDYPLFLFLKGQK